MPLSVVVRAVPEAVMDPCAVVDRSDGRVLLVYDRWPELVKDRIPKDYHRAAGLGRDSITVWVTTSTDDGLTWSEPRTSPPPRSDRNGRASPMGPASASRLAAGGCSFPATISTTAAAVS